MVPLLRGQAKEKAEEKKEGREKKEETRRRPDLEAYQLDEVERFLCASRGDYSPGIATPPISSLRSTDRRSAV